MSAQHYAQQLLCVLTGLTMCVCEWKKKKIIIIGYTLFQFNFWHNSVRRIIWNFLAKLLLVSRSFVGEHQILSRPSIDCISIVILKWLVDWLVDLMLLSKMSKVDNQNEVLPNNSAYSHPKASSKWQFWSCFNIWRFRHPLASVTWRDPRAWSNWS